LTTALFREQSELLLLAIAADLGCEAEALWSHALTVVEQPRPSTDGSVVLAVDSGLGTVLSVDAQLVDWAREHAPLDYHFRAMQPFFLAELALQAQAAGRADARARGYSLGFALAEEQEAMPLPEGFRLKWAGPEWMERYRESNVFKNAIGEPDERDRIEKTQTAFVAVDASGEPAAAVGVWDEGRGRDEIGVDVRREVRGLGLARPLVIAATRYILESGRVPFYSCGATNVRSHNNAIACGFRPVYTIAGVWARHRNKRRPSHGD
jgi:RimJ/RimL family protein N-acetyltransferase